MQPDAYVVVWVNNHGDVEAAKHAFGSLNMANAYANIKLEKFRYVTVQPVKFTEDDKNERHIIRS